MAPYAEGLGTPLVVLGREVLPRAARILKDALPAGAWVLVADETTYRVAGEEVEASLAGSGAAPERFIVEPLEGQDGPVADDASVERLAGLLRSGEGRVAVVAVGSGTVNDIAKMASFKAGFPYAVVATAPSMNGYTSAIAAILSGGVKTTPSCRPPVACLADVDVLAAAPYRMIASGLGDLVSKPVSNADWRLSRLLLGSEYSPKAVALMDETARLTRGIGPQLRAREGEAVARLAAALILSGFAMSVAGTSSPASGGEHLISHYLDMTHFAFGEEHDLHGCQVGVGTVMTAGLYEKLREFRPESVDIESRVASLAPWEEYESMLCERFGPIAHAVVPYARAGYPTPEVIRDRLSRLKAEWPEIVAEVCEPVPSAETIRAELASAGCPSTFPEINVTAERALRAVTHGKDIRSRYTILHLAWELGLLESWAGEVLGELHFPPGA